MRTALESLFERLMNESLENESCGSVDDIGYHALFRHPLKLAQTYASEELAELDPEDRELLENCAGAIVRQDHYGFIFIQFALTPEQLDQDWQNVEEMYREFFQEEEEEDVEW